MYKTFFVLANESTRGIGASVIDLLYVQVYAFQYTCSCFNTSMLFKKEWEWKFFWQTVYTKLGGGTDLERGYGDVRPWRSFFHASQFARVPFQAKESVHKTPFWENLEILASTASIFTQILGHKPPNLEIFSSQAPKFGNFQFRSPLFHRQILVRKPHTSEIRAAHPYLKKSWVPPPGDTNMPYSQVCLILLCLCKL